MTTAFTNKEQYLSTLRGELNKEKSIGLELNKKLQKLRKNLVIP